MDIENVVTNTIMFVAAKIRGVGTLSQLANNYWSIHIVYIGQLVYARSKISD